MRILDQLYGPWELPEVLAQLMQTKTAERMRDISMSVKPNELLIYGPLPSRCQHGLGAARLAQVVLEANPALSDHKRNLLLASAFLHDAGNPPFAHMAEPFMIQVIDRDGETFLTDILASDPDALDILAMHDLSSDEVVRTVTGRTAFSKVLHGSVDVDNLDNVRRYAHHAQIEAPVYDPMFLAKMFIWQDGCWYIRSGFEDSLCRWKQARALVYAGLSDTAVVAPDFMIIRAIKSAVEAGTLTREFFFLNDHQAIEWLCDNANTPDAWLVREVLRHRWFKPVYSVMTRNPTNKLRELGDDGNGRWALTSELIGRTEIAPNLIGVHTGKGKDTRKITLSVLDSDNGPVVFPDNEQLAVYRARAFLHNSVSAGLRGRIVSLMEEIVGHPNEINLAQL